MITKKKQKILTGIYNNLFSKILSYPSALIYSDFKKETEYELDILGNKIRPDVPTAKKELKEIHLWFMNKLKNNSIEKEDLKECTLKVNIDRKRFLFVPYKVFNFKLVLSSNRKVLSVEKVVKGWL